MSSHTRDPAQFNEASYTPDVAADCDTLPDHIRELVGEQLGGQTVDAKLRRKLEVLVLRVVSRLLDEGRLGALVDVKKLQGRDLIARLLAEIIDAPEARLMARCIDFVLETCVQMGLSETQIGDLEGVDKATVSRYCIMLKETYLGGRPARGMKSNEAVASYRILRTGRSSRGPRAEWAHAATFRRAFENAAA